MTTSPDIATNGTGPAARDPEAIRADIERTRDDLAETIDVLHAKLDVRSRARARLADVRDQATTDTGRPRPEVMAGAFGVVLAVAALVWWRRG
jgi:hypothetical protein